MTRSKARDDMEALARRVLAKARTAREKKHIFHSLIPFIFTIFAPAKQAGGMPDFVHLAKLHGAHGESLPKAPAIQTIS